MIASGTIFFRSFSGGRCLASDIPPRKRSKRLPPLLCSLDSLTDVVSVSSSPWLLFSASDDPSPSPSIDDAEFNNALLLFLLVNTRWCNLFLEVALRIVDKPFGPCCNALTPPICDEVKIEELHVVLVVVLHAGTDDTNSDMPRSNLIQQLSIPIFLIVYVVLFLTFFRLNAEAN